MRMCIMVSLSSSVTQGPYFRTYGPYFRTSSKSLNGRKIARMAPILTIFGPNRSCRRDLFFEKFSNERRRHRGIVLVVIVAVVVAVIAAVIVGRFGVASIKGPSLTFVTQPKTNVRSIAAQRFDRTFHRTFMNSKMVLSKMGPRKIKSSPPWLAK